MSTHVCDLCLEILGGLSCSQKRIHRLQEKLKVSRSAVSSETSSHTGALRLSLTSRPTSFLQSVVNHHNTVLNWKSQAPEVVSKSRKIFAPHLDIRDQVSIALIDSCQDEPENSGNGGPGASQENL
jgi:hypothetical protein